MYCPNPDCPHAQRAGEPAEYREGITSCEDCGSTLVDARPENETVDYEEFVPVFEITNAALVPVVESLLNSTDIRHFVKGEGVQDLFGWGRFGAGFSFVTGPPVVYVEPNRAEEARQLLADIHHDAQEENTGGAPDDGDSEPSS